VEVEGELAILDGEFVVGKPKICFEPLEEGGFEHATITIEGVSGEPDQFRFVKTAFAGLLQMLTKNTDRYKLCETDVSRAIDERERRLGARKTFPDELEHQEFVEIGVEQGAGNGIDFPVMVVSPARKIDDHESIRLPHTGRRYATETRQSTEIRNRSTSAMRQKSPPTNRGTTSIKQRR